MLRKSSLLSLLFFGMQSLAGLAVELQIQQQWNLFETYGREGHVGVRAFVDVDDDGQREALFNLGRSADFVALEMDGTELWRSTIEATNSKMGYFPRISEEEGLMFYASRASNTVHAIELATGDLAWSRKVSTQGNVAQLSIEVSDIGVIAGHSGAGGQTILWDFEGNVMPGWPILGPQHEQLLAAGDLDGDGQDEYVLDNNSGDFSVRNRDGSLLFSKSSQQNHIDYSVIADINRDTLNPNNIGPELLVAVDDDNSHSGEGDEIVLLNALGNEVARYETGHNGVSYAVGDVLPSLPGLEVFFGNEGSNTIGLLDHTLEPIFTTSLAPFAQELGISLSNAAGQTSLADLNGDGELELLINSGENSSAGILVFDASGNLLDAMIGFGWDFDPQMVFSSGDPRSKQLLDVTGDGRSDITASMVGANASNGDRTVYLLGDPTPTIPGDVNGDGDVDLQDFEIIQANFRNRYTGLSSGDLTGDGAVDFHDFRQWKSQYAFAGSQSDVQLVPEPNTWLLITIGWSSLLHRTGRNLQFPRRI